MKDLLIQGHCAKTLTTPKDLLLSYQLVSRSNLDRFSGKTEGKQRENREQSAAKWKLFPIASNVLSRAFST
jgi:hypothetical protein